MLIKFLLFSDKRDFCRRLKTTLNFLELVQVCI